MYYVPAPPLSPPEPQEFSLDDAPEDELHLALDAADDRGDYGLMFTIRQQLAWRFPEDDLDDL